MAERFPTERQRPVLCEGWPTLEQIRTWLVCLCAVGEIVGTEDNPPLKRYMSLILPELGWVGETERNGKIIITAQHETIPYMLTIPHDTAEFHRRCIAHGMPLRRDDALKVLWGNAKTEPKSTPPEAT